jgi:peptidase inhibitor family I36
VRVCHDYFSSGELMRTARTTLAAFFVALACATALAFAGATSAASCPSGYACGWVNPNFGQPRGQWAVNVSNFSAYAQPACGSGTWNGCISSDANSGTQCTVHFWTDVLYQGTRHNVARGSFEGGLGSLNDTFSSMNWC